MSASQKTDRRTLVVFGDQTTNVSIIAKQLFLGVSQSAAATEFIRDASAALMTQKDRLRPFQRKDLPEFKNLYDMARIYEEAGGVCHPSITSVILCATQLLQLFRLVSFTSFCHKKIFLLLKDILKNVVPAHTKTRMSRPLGCAPAPWRLRPLRLPMGSTISHR